MNTETPVNRFYRRLLESNPNFDPRRCFPQERAMYVAAFREWVRLDDIENVTKCLETVNPNEHPADGTPALHYCKSLAMLDLLLAHGADVFLRDCEHCLPIASSKSVEIFKRLAEVMTATDPNSIPSLNAPMSEIGATFFQALIQCQSFELIEWLIGGNWIETPQLFSRLDNNYDTMNLAIIYRATTSVLAAIHGALPADYEFDAMGLLSLAARLGNGEAVRYFARFVKDIDQELGKDRVTVLMQAARKMNFSACEALLELGADPNRFCGNGCCSSLTSVLIFEGERDVKLRLLQLFASKGANFDQSFPDGNNLLSYAAVCAGAECFEFIAARVPSGAFDVCYDGKKLIHLVTMTKSVPMMLALFQYAPHVNVNEYDAQGFTALGTAACKNAVELCRFLVGKGANADLLNAGSKPSKLARMRGFDQLAGELRSYQTEKELVCC